jgi:hypothetical protein
VRKPAGADADRELGEQIDRLALDDAPPPPPADAKAGKGPRVTEFYDNYLDSYTEEEEAPPMPPVPAQQPDRVAQWAKNNADPRRAEPPRRAPSTYAPSSYGGGSMRRRGTRRSNRGPSSRAQSTYEEEEEGYGSGDDDMIYELVKIRVKVRARCILLQPHR